jgi:hypothetical protein
MMGENIKRCAQCIMPASVPGVTLNKDGICNFCLEFKEITYLGKEKLDNIIDSIRDKAPRYDCIVPMSGGRDSTYALYVARKIYNLRTLAVNYDNEFRHAQALANIKKACEILETEFISVRSAKDLGRKIVRSTIREYLSMGRYGIPPETCIACMYGIKSIPYREAERQSIPLLIYAGSQEEKSKDMITKVFSAVNIPFRRIALGKLNHLNPVYLKFRYYQMLQKREFNVSGNSIFSSKVRPTLKNKGITELHLFDYIPWDRKQITETITKELGWERTPGHISSWRNDCALHQYVNYDFITHFGCTRDCFGYCRMINSGKMKREEALKQEEAMLASYNSGAINNVNIEELLLHEVGLSKKEIAKVLSTL